LSLNIYPLTLLFSHNSLKGEQKRKRRENWQKSFAAKIVFGSFDYIHSMLGGRERERAIEKEIERARESKNKHGRRGGILIFILG
jgi:hypothetical protein